MPGSVGASDVAKYLLGSAHEHGSFVSNLKLQKLLYYSQGWHLGIFAEPLFPDKLEAWVHGPVVPSVYREYKNYSWRNIDAEVDKPRFEPRVEDFLDELIGEYLHMDAYDLERRTHRERPWIEARAGIPIDEPSGAEIREELMREHFAALVPKDGD